MAQDKIACRVKEWGREEPLFRVQIFWSFSYLILYPGWYLVSLEDIDINFTFLRIYSTKFQDYCTWGSLSTSLQISGGVRITSGTWWKKPHTCPRWTAEQLDRNLPGQTSYQGTLAYSCFKNKKEQGISRASWHEKPGFQIFASNISNTNHWISPTFFKPGFIDMLCPENKNITARGVKLYPSICLSCSKRTILNNFNVPEY